MNYEPLLDCGIYDSEAGLLEAHWVGTHWRLYKLDEDGEYLPYMPSYLYSDDFHLTLVANSRAAYLLQIIVEEIQFRELMTQTTWEER
jgi:hypothetical protein